MVYIPGFLASKIYERGSLRNTDSGFELVFCNRMTPLRVSGVRDLSLKVDGVEYPPEKVSLSLGGNPIDLCGEGTRETHVFARDKKLVVEVEAAPLPEGKHVLEIGLITREYGGASIKVSDTVGPGRGAVPSLLSRLAGRLGLRKEVPGVVPVSLEGELGGVALDPDFARLEAAIRREEPDRVPLFEADVALPLQEAFLGRELETARDEVEFYIRAGYDFVPVVAPFFAPRLMRMVGGATNTDTGDSQRAWISESEGIIKTLRDVENFPWPKAEEVDMSSFHEMAPLLPPKMKVIGMLVPAAVFGNTSQAMGLENFSYALFENPALVEALFEIIGSTFVKIARRMVQMPRLGAVFMADDLGFTGGPLVSPEVYRKYVFPWYRQIGEILAEAGLPFLFHSDGTLLDVMDDLADCGIQAIHPIEPQAMDIVEVKRRYGDRFCIFGNIDLDYTLTLGSVADVVEQVKRRIRELAPGGGYGLSASNSIPDYVKPENYRAMVEAAKKYGAYPIQV